MNDHKKYYGIYIRSSLLVSIILAILAFLFVPTVEVQPFRGTTIPIDSILPPDIFPPIEPLPEPPKEPRPNLPVQPAEPGDTNAVNTIDSTVFIEDPIRVPIHPRIDIVPYHKLSIKPQPIYIPSPIYPELARKAGIEGRTVISALVNIDGSIVEVKILKSSGNQMLDQAALAAAKRARFTPARQRDKYVRVWVSIPVKFRLTG